MHVISLDAAHQTQININHHYKLKTPWWWKYHFASGVVAIYFGQKNPHKIHICRGWHLDKVSPVLEIENVYFEHSCHWRGIGQLQHHPLTFYFFLFKWDFVQSEVYVYVIIACFILFTISTHVKINMQHGFWIFMICILLHVLSQLLAFQSFYAIASYELDDSSPILAVETICLFIMMVESPFLKL